MRATRLLELHRVHDAFGVGKGAIRSLGLSDDGGVSTGPLPYKVCGADRKGVDLMPLSCGAPMGPAAYPPSIERCRRQGGFREIS